MARGRSADYELNRETIVRTATRLFAQQGYPGTSMSDLARECGISKPLLYHYVSDKYELLSRTDALTGLCNRRTFTETLNARVREAQWLDGAGVSLALLDIDHFKHFNDAYGHNAGDAVLRAMGDLLKGFLRAGDIACRYGGEEVRGL